MLIFRLVAGLLLLASLVCFALFVVTRQQVWMRRGVLILKWLALAAIGFIALLLFERLVVML